MVTVSLQRPVNRTVPALGKNNDKIRRLHHDLTHQQTCIVLTKSRYSSGESNVTAHVPIQPVRTCDDKRRVADMRAEAFYENSHFDRFISTYKKKFSDTEYERLMRSVDVADTSVVGTFVALDQSTPEGMILGCMDVLRASPQVVETSSGIDLEGWYYIKNVVVDPKHRRQGIARQMLLSVEERIRCSSTLSGFTQGIFVHVELSNIDAVALYKSVGYEYEDSSVASGPVSVGVMALLLKTL